MRLPTEPPMRPNGPSRQPIKPSMRCALPGRQNLPPLLPAMIPLGPWWQRRRRGKPQMRPSVALMNCGSEPNGRNDLHTRQPSKLSGQINDQSRRWRHLQKPANWHDRQTNGPYNQDRSVRKGHAVRAANVVASEPMVGPY
jgi:hypothetical protein